MSKDSQPFKVFVLSIDIETCFCQHVLSGSIQRYIKVSLQKSLITFSFSCALALASFLLTIGLESFVLLIFWVKMRTHCSSRGLLQFDKFNQHFVASRSCTFIDSVMQRQLGSFFMKFIT